MSDNQEYVYPYGFDYAKRGMPEELEAFRLSWKLNIACAVAISKAIDANFHDNSLHDDAAKQVIEEYGYDRVNYVLANTIQQLREDGRFSQEHKAWAKQFSIPGGEIAGKDMRWDFIVNAHPAILDGFVTDAIRAYASLELMGAAEVQESGNLHYANQVLVLKPQLLKTQYKTPDNQLFLAQNGFGCSPMSSGRKVFGVFLVDGERDQYERQDFLGVVKEECLPQWAREKLAQITQQVETANPTMEQTM